MAIENLTTYTEVDSAGDLTITSASAAFDTMPRQVVSYVYKDFGASYFSDFDIDFEFQITAISTTGIATVFSLSNTIGTFQDQLTANDGLIVVVYGNTSNFQIQIRDENTDTTDLYTYGGTSTPILYCTAKRNSTTFTLDVYSDSGRTALLDTLSISCETGAKRYLSVVQSRDAGSGDSITGYSQNYEIQFASSSSLSSSSLSSSSSSSSSSLSSSSSSTSSSSSSSSSSISSSSLSSSSLSSSSLSSSSSSSSLSSSSSSSSTSMTVPSLKHFWYTLRDTAGEPREGETVYAYEATSTASSTVSTLLNIYDFRGRPIANPMTTSTGTSGVSAGIIDFFIRDEMWPSGGYEWDQRIALQWDHDGVTKTADRIMTWGDFHPIYDERFDPLDFSQITPPSGDDIDDKNKAISNSLACKLQSHIESMLGEDI